MYPQVSELSRCEATTEHGSTVLYHYASDLKVSNPAIGPTRSKNIRLRKNIISNLREHTPKESRDTRKLNAHVV